MSSAAPAPVVALLWGVLSFLLGFLLTCTSIGLWSDRRIELRLTPGSLEEQKFRWFRAHADDYDLVYVGSSHVLRGFDPCTFDARSAALGRSLRSFNFGLVGLGFFEQEYMVDWILAQRPARLRTLVIEPPDRDVVLHRANFFTARDVNWHTPGETRAAIVAAWGSGRELLARLDLTRLHVLHALQRATNLGLGVNGLRRALEPVLPDLAEEGFGGRDSREPRGEEREERVGSAEREFLVGSPPPVMWRTFRAVCARIRAHGLEAAVVLPPTQSPDYTSQAQRRGDLPELRSYPPPSFPVLFEDRAGHFYDAGHLNRRGAALFSARLAQDLAAEIAKGD